MPYYNKELSDWVRSLHIPGARAGYNPFADPNFDADKLDINEIDMGQHVIAKIPKITDRIRETHSEEKGETYIELITDRERDEQTGEIREKTVRIGTDLGRLLPGMMDISEEYHNYFDLKGNLIYDPLGRKEAEEREKAKAEAEKKAAEQARAEAEKKAAEQAAREKERAKQVPQKTVKTVRGAERTVDEIKESLLQKERELEEKLHLAKVGLRELKEKKEELDELIEARHFEYEERERAQINLLSSILHNHLTIVETQAKRKPDMLMRRSQIRTINEILKELRDYFSGSNAADYLHLAEEPHEDDLEHFPGTTYGEMAVLLAAYSSTLHMFSMEELYEKQNESSDGTTEDE